MNQYLLLRDNKQTGPYTAQQLAEKGLKPYDLVWLEGKSAAWRYPGELEELKAFAPGVEEQPYDRFYKKPGEQSTEQATAVQQTEQVKTVQESQPVNKKVEQTSKHIYVTMPGGSRTTTAATAKKEETAKPVAQQNDKSAQTAAVAKSTEKKAAASTYIISEEDDELNSSMLKGHQSRKKEDDVINNDFISDYESRKAAYSKQRSTGASAVAVKETVAEKPVAPKKESWSTPVRKKEQFDLKAMLAGSGKYLQDNKNVTRVLVAVVLILGGVVIGLVINKGKSQPDTQALESLVKEIREQQNEKGGSGTPAVETAQKENQPREEERSSSNEYDHNNSIADPAQQPQASINNNQPNQQQGQRAVIKKDNNVVPPPQTQNNRSITVSVSNPSSQQVEATSAVLETREKPINQEVIEKARKNIYDQVRAEASAFKVGVFGGVSDLDITLVNTSLYTLDQVAVEVKYFGMEKKLVKTQTIIFNNVPPGKRRTLEVPKTSRGITIDYTITSINSKALGLAQAGF